MGTENGTETPEQEILRLQRERAELLMRAPGSPEPQAESALERERRLLRETQEAVAAREAHNARYRDFALPETWGEKDCATKLVRVVVGLGAGWSLEQIEALVATLERVGYAERETRALELLQAFEAGVLQADDFTPETVLAPARGLLGAASVVREERALDVDLDGELPEGVEVDLAEKDDKAPKKHGPLRGPLRRAIDRFTRGKKKKRK